MEIIEDAINDAKFNAAENDIQNAKFYAGNCDDYIHWLVHEAKNENLLAILDPPRAGIRKWISFVVVFLLPIIKCYIIFQLQNPDQRKPYEIHEDWIASFILHVHQNQPCIIGLI